MVVTGHRSDLLKYVFLTILHHCLPNFNIALPQQHTVCSAAVFHLVSHYFGNHHHLPHVEDFGLASHSSRQNGREIFIPARLDGCLIHQFKTVAQVTLN